MLPHAARGGCQSPLLLETCETSCGVRKPMVGLDWHCYYCISRCSQRRHQEMEAAIPQCIVRVRSTSVWQFCTSVSRLSKKLASASMYLDIKLLLGALWQETRTLHVYAEQIFLTVGLSIAPSGSGG